jgi:hypothetical protein
VLLGAGAAALIIALESGPASAGVGTRLANGDGDTSGKCMSIINAGRSTSVEMEGCSTNAHQGWVLDAEYDFWFRIKSQDADAGGRCLTAHGQGVRVTMDRCSTDIGSSLYERQIWTRWLISGNWYQFENAFPFAQGPQCLDVRDNGLSNVVQIWQCGPTSGPNVKGNQEWKFF